ncbi:MAG: LytTR family transcriptional regulator DNA-binding domain-containing protein, partial [Cyclobacteriaceae bacterium]
DIHMLSNGERKKVIFRSSLKNMETQLVNPLTPIHRAHRSYLINIGYFKLKKRTSRLTTIELKKFGDELPVSSKYVDEITALLQFHT